jgi:hypothetical protein
MQENERGAGPGYAAKQILWDMPPMAAVSIVAMLPGMIWPFASLNGAV